MYVCSLHHGSARAARVPDLVQPRAVELVARQRERPRRARVAVRVPVREDAAAGRREQPAPRLRRVPHAGLARSVHRVVALGPLARRLVDARPPAGRAAAMVAAATAAAAATIAAAADAAAAAACSRERQTRGGWAFFPSAAAARRHRLATAAVAPEVVREHVLRAEVGGDAGLHLVLARRREDDVAREAHLPSEPSPRARDGTGTRRPRRRRRPRG